MLSHSVRHVNFDAPMHHNHDGYYDLPMVTVKEVSSAKAHEKLLPISSMVRGFSTYCLCVALIDTTLSRLSFIHTPSPSLSTIFDAPDGRTIQYRYKGSPITPSSGSGRRNNWPVFTKSNNGFYRHVDAQQPRVILEFINCNVAGLSVRG